MKVVAVTPVDAASDPLHPDHDRWVKEKTLAMEVAHAQRAGLSLRHAETENAFWLARAEAKAREAKPVAPVASQRKAGRLTRDERLAARPVKRKVGKLKPIVEGAKTSPCGRCGVCRACKREKRIYAMTIKAKREGDTKLAEIIKNLWLDSMQARDLTGPYFGMKRSDAERILVRKLEDICDATVMQMGPWL